MLCAPRGDCIRGRRSRITCSAHWASQALPTEPHLGHLFLVALPPVRSDARGGPVPRVAGSGRASRMREKSTPVTSGTCVSSSKGPPWSCAPSTLRQRWRREEVKLELGSHIVTKRSGRPTGVGTEEAAELPDDVESSRESTLRH